MSVRAVLVAVGIAAAPPSHVHFTIRSRREETTEAEISPKPISVWQVR